jgi:hypothetical protein
MEELCAESVAETANAQIRTRLTIKARQDNSEQCYNIGNGATPPRAKPLADGDEAGNVIETREQTGGFQSVVKRACHPAGF